MCRGEEGGSPCVQRWGGGPCETIVPQKDSGWEYRPTVQQEETEFLAKRPECGLLVAIRGGGTLSYGQVTWKAKAPECDI